MGQIAANDTALDSFRDTAIMDILAFADGALALVFLPLALAAIMFALGIGLTIKDFRDVATAPKAFWLGSLAQMVLLPIIAFGLVMVVNLPPVLSFGILLLSFCPGGVTSNVLTHLAKGRVALSVSLTGVSSLVSIITIPLLVTLAAGHFLGETQRPSITGIGLVMFGITGVPVALGVALRHYRPSLAERIEPMVVKIAGALFLIIVAAGIAANWDTFVKNFPVLGPTLVLLNVVLFGVGYGMASLAGLPHRDRITLTLDTGVQNAALGVTLGGLLVATGDAMPEVSLPAGVYGITFYLCSAPVIWAFRRKT